MMQGKTRDAMQLVSEDGNGILMLDDKIDNDRTVRDVLYEKHPEGAPIRPEANH